MTFDEMKCELQERALEEFEALTEERRLVVEFDAKCAVKLLFALARASHHTKGIIREQCLELGRDIQRQYLEPGSVLDGCVDLMWERDDLVMSLVETIPVPDAFRIAFKDRKSVV